MRQFRTYGSMRGGLERAIPTATTYLASFYPYLSFPKFSVRCLRPKLQKANHRVNCQAKLLTADLSNRNDIL